MTGAAESVVPVTPVRNVRTSNALPASRVAKVKSAVAMVAAVYVADARMGKSAVMMATATPMTAVIFPLPDAVMNRSSTIATTANSAVWTAAFQAVAGVIPGATELAATSADLEAKIRAARIRSAVLPANPTARVKTAAAMGAVEPAVAVKRARTVPKPVSAPLTVKAAGIKSVVSTTAASPAAYAPRGLDADRMASVRTRTAPHNVTASHVATMDAAVRVVHVNRNRPAMTRASAPQT